MPDIISMDTIYKSGGGLCFGSLHGDHIGWAQAGAVQNTWYNIVDADIVDGMLHNVTHDGNGKLTVIYAGMYIVSWTCTYEVDAANTHVDGGIEISGSGDGANAEAHLESKFANSEEFLTGIDILDLAANATLEIAIRTIDAGTPDFTVDNVHIMCIQIGGT